MKSERKIPNESSRIVNTFSNNQEKMDNSIMNDDNFVALINGLNESIKEYYKVSHHNISETNNFISFYEQISNNIETIINEIINTNQLNRIEEFILQINKANEIMNQLQLNSNSSQKNLELFFEDAKILFKKMKMKRKEKLSIINNFTENNNMNNSNRFNSKTNNNNFVNENNQFIPFNASYNKINNLLNKLNDFNYIINGVDKESFNNYINIQKNIKIELETLMKLIKNNLKQNSLNLDQTDKLRSKSSSNNINREMENLKNMNKQNQEKIKYLMNQLNIYHNIKTLRDSGTHTDNDSNKTDLNPNIRINKNLNLKIMKLEKLIKEKDIIINSLKNSNIQTGKNLVNNNQNLNLINLINQKDGKIYELEQELNVYKQNENILNNQIPDLNNKFQMKINQYENQIAILNNKNIALNRVIINKNKEILKIQNENKLSLLNNPNIKVYNEDSMKNTENSEVINGLKNDIEKYKNMIAQYENQIIELSNNGVNNQKNNNNISSQNKIEMLNKQIESLTNKNGIYEQNLNSMKEKYNQLSKYFEEQKMAINQLNREIMNYKRKEKQNEETNNKYMRQIEEMNNNILSTNRIIEQKDALIKQLNERKEIIDNKMKIPQNNNELNNNINNNELYSLKLENETLKKQIELLKLNKNNYYGMNNNNLNLLKNQIINGDNLKEIQELNIQLMEENNSIQMKNQELMEKVQELTLQNNNLQKSLNGQKEEITKLDKEITKKNDELEGLKAVIFKLNSRLEMKEENIAELKKKNEIEIEKAYYSQENRKSFHERKNSQSNKKNITSEKKTNEAANNGDTNMIKNILNKLNEAEKKIAILQNKNKELQFKLEEKLVEKEISGYRTEDNNFSNYEEEFDLKKMVNGARDKNRSEDINIDYPGVQGIKDKYKELLQNMNMLKEQVKILILNINCNNKIKPQVRQICQLMGINAKKIELIIAGKDKKKSLGIID